MSSTVVAAQLGIYRPSAADERGRRVLAWDEDSTTLAVDAARLVIDGASNVRAITIVSRTPTYLTDDAAAVITKALRVGDEVEVTQIQGGGPAALVALSSAAPGTIVIALDTEGAVGAAAVLVESEDARPQVVGRRRHSVPYRVRRSDSADTSVYDDDRLVRERAWRPAVEALAEGEPVVITGIPGRVGSRLGGTSVPGLDDALESTWAALAATASGGRVIAVDGASAVAIDIPSGTEVSVARDERPTYAAPAIVAGPAIPLSLAAYERAFDAKVGLVASRCACGAVHFPPRDFCPVCGKRGQAVPVQLSHRASVYSVVTVRVPIPSMPRAYSLAIVDIEDSEVRALAHVTGAPAGEAAIDDRGRLVLRRVAERDGVPDYGYAFLKEQAQ